MPPRSDSHVSYKHLKSVLKHGSLLQPQPAVVTRNKAATNQLNCIPAKKMGEELGPNKVLARPNPALKPEFAASVVSDPTAVHSAIPMKCPRLHTIRQLFHLKIAVDNL